MKNFVDGIITKDDICKLKAGNLILCGEKYEYFLGFFYNINNVPYDRGIYGLYYMNNNNKQIRVKIILRDIKIKIDNLYVYNEKKEQFKPYLINNNDNYLMYSLKYYLNQIKFSIDDLNKELERNNYISHDAYNIQKMLKEGNDLTFNKLKEIISLIPNTEMKLIIKESK